MKLLPLLGSSSVLLSVCLFVLGPTRAHAATITPFGPPIPTTTELTPTPPGTFPGFTGYRFSLGDYFPPTPNPLPQVAFTENEFSTNLILIGGFVGVPSQSVDPILVDQTVEFDITGAFWRHHLTLTLHPKMNLFFDSDTVTVKGFVQHLVAPHAGEVAPGPEINLEGTVAGNAAVTLPPDAFIRADQFRRELQRHGINLPAQGRFGFDAEGEIHTNGSHEDFAIALLAAQAPGANAETFEWYEVGTAASHPVPEPSGFALLLSGVILIACRVRCGTSQIFGMTVPSREAATVHSFRVA